MYQNVNWYNYYLIKVECWAVLEIIFCKFKLFLKAG